MDFKHDNGLVAVWSPDKSIPKGTCT